MPQWVFLSLPNREAFYGGAAGGGKSDALLMAGLQFVHKPNYAGLILRRTYSDLALPGALMDRAASWLMGTAAHWDDSEKTWTFPSGATLTFGYLANPRDKYRYQSSEFQLVAFDELTQFPEADYRYLFSRLRRSAASDVPVRMRAGSNPGGTGHGWVYERFIVTGGRQSGRIFVPARLEDNPYLDQAEYRESLAELDPITRRQLLEGAWVVDTSLNPFDRRWWDGKNRYDPAQPPPTSLRYISWDTAESTSESAAYTACVVGDIDFDSKLRIREVWRGRLTFPELTAAIIERAERWNYDGRLFEVVIENKSSGKSAVQTVRATAPRWLRPRIGDWTPRSSKEQRANQAAVWCKLGMVQMPEPSEAVPWLHTLENELYTFPNSAFKDQVDAFSQLVIYTEPTIRTGYKEPEGVDAHAAD